MELSPETRKNANFTSQKPDDGIVFQVGVHERLGPHNNPHMFVCRLDEFLKHYRPSEPVLDDDIYRCLEIIISGGLAVNSEDGRYLWTVPPTFDLLKDIINCVLDFVKNDAQKKDNMHFMVVHHDAAASCCFIPEPLVYPSTKFANRDNNASPEGKKIRNANERDKLHLRILGACHRIMTEDIRRMWIYGLTFEDNLCSLWYFSRTHSVKTKAFDWFEDPKGFVHVLLAFAKATPRELGIDPTVHLVLEGEDKRQSFVYEVPVKKIHTHSIKRYYKTLEDLCENRHMAIADRTTHIWKVVEVTDASGKELVEPSREMVLKDVWVSTDRDTEGQNQDAIFAAVDKYVENGLEAQRQEHPAWNDKELLTQHIQKDPRFQSFDQISVDRLCANLTNKAYRNLFLTKVHEWQGETCKAVGENVWRDTKLFSSSSVMDLACDYLDSIEDPQPSSSKHPKRTNCPSTAQHEAFGVQDIHRSYSTQRQSRFIYGEVCTTLQNLGTVGEVADVLYQTMDAMHILFLAGWVHRDISSNNIMAYRSNPKDPWAVKLADLEFSRLMVDPTRQANVDPRTGTPHFMPVEILNKAYLLDNFRQTSPFDNSSIFDKSNLSEGSRLLPEMASLQPFSLPSFSKRPQVTQRNLAVQLNASTIGQAYVDNLKHYRAFPDEATMLDMELEPRWTDVPEDSAVVNHNYQHDLESIWWILLWIITCRIRHGPSALRMRRYFDRNMNNSEARSRLFEQGLAADKVNLLEDIRPLWPVVEALRKVMYAASLMRAILGHLKIAEAYSSIQGDFSQSLHFLHRLGGTWRDIALQRSSTSPTQPSTAITQDTSTTTGKRPHEATVEDPCAEDRTAPKRICL